MTKSHHHTDKTHFINTSLADTGSKLEQNAPFVVYDRARFYLNCDYLTIKRSPSPPIILVNGCQWQARIGMGMSLVAIEVVLR